MCIILVSIPLIQFPDEDEEEDEEDEDAAAALGCIINIYISLSSIAKYVNCPLYIKVIIKYAVEFSLLRNIVIWSTLIL